MGKRIAALALYLAAAVLACVSISGQVFDDAAARATAERREQARIKQDLIEKWNTYVLRMNAVMSDLGNDVVNRKMYRLAMEAEADLRRCEGWPFKGEKQ